MVFEMGGFGFSPGFKLRWDCESLRECACGSGVEP